MRDAVPFRVELRPGAGSAVVVVAVAGEVDLSTVAELRQKLTEAIGPARREVVVDLADVEFIDAGGVGALVGAAGEAARAGVKFRLKAPSPSVDRVLNLARLDASIEVER